MKKHSKIIDWTLLTVCIIYFTSRIIYGIYHIVIRNLISIALSNIVGVKMLCISLILFFYKRRKKEAIKPFIIAMVLICVNFIG